jgi:bifunctional DNA-binding transcriptional regulator/antitoxin component of YhaV-PrlF toxin-antitoxin module
MIKVTQKLIAIGSSEGVTIPPKELAKLGAKRGDVLKITAELEKKPQQIKHAKFAAELDKFMDIYDQDLKNLASR